MWVCDHSAIERSEAVIQVTTWMGTLSTPSSVKKPARDVRFHIHEMSRVDTAMGQRSSGVPGGGL
jgi:hypothetical protein